ncbi:aliphatic sulfonate ABC transporter permease SsuC [Nostoc sp. FACHB-87]|uniref:aliphatic sulfonate ABC transporter permease SsuC n=2 Tax=Cyanophyceae TaxID=3028117 RepID=UPI0016865AA4|nr:MULTISPECIES: aliphatic sulfonate ABC transporter permease SsuC [Nostocales]MBD2298730.1 aliphatic sulfonate ABC transporter permease SsuC [Nostoc sp. FACHB-190]MBD2454500.1 aliphatic sulfonate ABC transporter permease SsuC [Nostoc sp. FACHB-87]MBD2474314.1 aliphatic sulfonate ABC transporter permease SsuC [Anabaena sp. FACHB-83]MBD2487140.1 aliphatic sulfonate ABC transporter permease SsuC [Aulosira sp. FACHB-615]
MTITLKNTKNISISLSELFQNQQVQKIVPWIVPISVVILWELSSRVGLLSNRILPAPSGVVITALRLAASGELFQHIGISAGRAISGFLVGGSIGFSLGLLNGIFPVAEKLLDSSLQMLRTIPNLALIPLVILWFGIGDQARLFLVSMGVFFPLYLNTFHGIRSVNPGLIEMGRVYGLKPVQLLWQIILPGALSSILVGVRFSLGIMWLTLIVAETIAADSGLGYMAMNAREFMQTDVVVLSIFIYALLGKLADATARFLERKWLAWHPNYQNV